MEDVVIVDDDEIRRFINPDYLYDDGRISPSAYVTKDMSLDLCRLRTLEESKAAAKPGWGQTEFRVAVLTSLNHRVVYDPIKDDPELADNPAHCCVPGKLTGSQAKKVRDAARCVYRP